MMKCYEFSFGSIEWHQAVFPSLGYKSYILEKISWPEDRTEAAQVTLIIVAAIFFANRPVFIIPRDDEQNMMS